MEDDMISKLPDSLIANILWYLPTKEVVKTSVLSSRWKSLWLLIPCLDLDSNEFPDYDAFKSFMDRFLSFSKEHKSCLHKLKLTIRKDENGQPCVTRWIDIVATSKLQHLDVAFPRVKDECFEAMPLSLYMCHGLLYLRLHQVALVSFDSVSLPCVKTMHLERNVYANEAAMELLLSSCPALEDLVIVRRVDDNVKVLRVLSRTLTSLSIEFGTRIEWYLGYEEEEFDSENSGIIIDAPRLKYLNLESDLSESKIIRNSGSLTKVNILGSFDLGHSVVSIFFTSLSGVTGMKISPHTFEFIETKLGSLPQFCDLTCLEVDLFVSSVGYLPTLLVNCPSLKSLILELCHCPPVPQITLSFVPQCLLTSLEFVEIKDDLSRTFCFRMVLELTSYFAAYSVILNKIVLHSSSILLPEEYPLRRAHLFGLPRQSSTCQIMIRHP